MRRLVGGLSYALVRGVVRHGASVCMVPVPRCRIDEADLLRELRIGREARVGVHAIEAFLRD